jgi:outer membrane receptor for ferric coprogen and ferric-rhodotorulic acid
MSPISKQQAAHQKHGSKLTPLAFAVQLIFVGSVMFIAAPDSATAQTAASAQQATFTFDIAAGDLAAALRQAGSTAGVILSFTPAQTNSKQTQGVKGNYTFNQALQILLSGTGLTSERSANGSYALQTLAGGDKSVLPEVVVTAGAGVHDATTEGSGTYAAQATTIFKGAKTLREIPQSVSVITRQQMDDQGLANVEDVFTQLPGARIDGYTGTMRVIARGFQTSVQIDGVPEQQEFGGTSFKLDPVIYDRVEMLRGPSGLVTGTGEPGGTINLVRKRPLDKFSMSGNVSYGSWSNTRTDIDITGPLNEDGSLRGRAVGVLQNHDQFYDAAHAKRSLFYGALEYDLTPRDTVGIMVTRMKDANNTYWGFPLYADGSLPGRNAFVGSTDYATTLNMVDATVDYQHHFDSGWKGKAAYSYRKDDKSLAGAYALEGMNVTTGLVSALGINRKDFTRYHSFDMNMSGPFSLWGQTHQATVGYNQTRQSWDVPRRLHTFYSSVDVLNQHQWGITEADLQPYGNAHVLEQSGLYGSLNLKVLKQLSLMVGGRFTNYESKRRETYATPWVAGNDKTSNEFTPYAGLVYDLSDQLSVYGSYAQIFVPQSVIDFSGSTLKPRTGEQYELGIKGAFLDNKLNASLAIYQMNDKNRAINDTDPTHICPGAVNQICSRAAGEIRTRGIEAEVSGTPVPGWYVSGSYTYTDSIYLSDTNPANVGKTQAGYYNPKHLFKLWTQYDLGYSGFDQLTGWTVGGGVLVQSDISDACPYIPAGICRQGGYAVTSAKIGYQINRNLNLSFDVDNLFDRTYLANLGDDMYYNMYGKPRSYRLNLSYKFD